MKITQYNGTAATTGLDRKIKYIAIHYTGNTRSDAGVAKNVIDGWKKKQIASADFVVDDEMILQYNANPEKRFCWAVGGHTSGTKGGTLYRTANNANTISIEMVSSNSEKRIADANDKSWYFTEEVISNAVDMTKYLMKKYNIPVSNVVRHYDISGKLCPGIVGWNEDSGSAAVWSTFKKLLIDDNTKSEDKSYVVSVTADVLNIRSGPGTKYSKTGVCKKGEAYTIVEESGSWGRLKSGAGWIYLKYTKKSI